MTTQDEYVKQCETDNPEMHTTENDVYRKLSDKEYNAAVKAWALMRWYQDNPDEQPLPNETSSS